MQGRLDMAIDRAVREMLDVEPPAGLRGRVLDRIESPRRGFGWMWIAAPLAAAMLILAVLAPWRQVAPPVVTPGPPSVARAEQPVTLPPTIAPAAPPKTAESPKTIPVPRPDAMGERLVVAGALPAADADSVIEPLGSIAPITVAAVRPASLPQTEIAISPLAPIAELQIAPLSPPDRRN